MTSPFKASLSNIVHVSALERAPMPRKTDCERKITDYTVMFWKKE
jgi:hypothetical protein